MIRKTEKLLITFFTTTEAMAMEQLCKTHSVAGRIIPVPGNISADCGLGWCSNIQDEALLLSFMEQHNVYFQGIHRCLL